MSEGRLDGSQRQLNIAEALFHALNVAPTTAGRNRPMVTASKVDIRNFLAH